MSTERSTLSSPRALAGIAFARPRQFNEGDFILEAGAAVEAVYLIRSGQVRCFLLDADGRETTTAILGRGQLVGIAPLLGKTVHHEFAQALTAVDAWALPAEAVRQELAHNPSLVGLMLGCLGQRLAVTLGLLKSVALLPVTERVRDMQLRLPTCLGDSPQTLKRTTLAGFLQMRPETLARTPTVAAAPARRDPATELPRHASGRRAFAAKEVVVDDDLPAGCLGVVHSGQLEVSLVGSGNRVMLVDRLGEGDLFGFDTLLGLPPIGVRLVGLAPGSLEILPANEVPNWFAERPAQCGELLRRVAARLQRLERSLARAGMSDVSERLIDLLRELSRAQAAGAAGGAHTLAGDWSHENLARHIGVCRETVTRGLAALAKSGVIRRRGREIVLLLPGTYAPEAAPHATGLEARPAPRGPAHPSAAPLLPPADAKHREAVQHRPAPNGTVRQASPASPPRSHTKCCLCGLRCQSRLCEGCAERLEYELQTDARVACPNCGRHRELCEAFPCTGARPTPSEPAERATIVWLPVSAIDEPPDQLNSRREYSGPAIAELAASLREHGFLQPLCVRPRGDRYELVFGVRRLRAAKQAQIREVPCIVRAADDDRAFLLNALENLHREQLSSVERVRTIERLAATGLGVREISRRTGFNASTISRWLRINNSAILKQALESGQLDIARAAILVEAPESAMPGLVEIAPHLSASDLRERVAAVRRSRLAGGLDDDHYLREALRSLRAARIAHDRHLVDSIRREVERLACDDAVDGRIPA